MSELERFKEGESKFNASVKVLERVHDLQLRLDMYREMNNWQGMNGMRETLDSLQMELSGYISEEELRDLEHLRVVIIPSAGRNTVARLPPIELREKLRTWELSLRRLVVKKGMGLIAKEQNTIFILPGGSK